MAANSKDVRMPPVMTAEEVCKLLRIHNSTLYRLIQQGQIPYFRLGTDYRFNREVIDSWSRSSGRKITR